MKNVLLFFKRNVFNIIFLALLVISLSLLFNKNPAQKVFYESKINNIATNFNKYFFSLNNFFYLNKTNEKLLIENAKLRNLLKENYINYDTNTYTVNSKIKRDSIETFRKYKYYEAKVVGNTYSLQQNYLTLEKGTKHNFNTDMAIVSIEGYLVGISISSNEYYTRVMSLLNRQSKVSAMLKKNKTTGNIEWDGVSANYVSLNNVSKTFKINIGDTVVTSNYSSNYPPSILIGTIAEIENNQNSNFYFLKVKLFADFTSLEYVYGIENTYLLPQKNIESENQ